MMRHSLAVVIFIVSIATISIGCSKITFAEDSYSNKQYQLGSARSLTGNIYTLSCFVSDSNNTWTDAEKIQIFNKLHNANKWIASHALKYNNRISFSGGNFGLKEDIKLDYVNYGTGTGNEDINLISTVLRKIGYAGSLSYYEWAVNNTNCDNTFVLIFVKGRGVNYAIAYKDKEMNKERYFVEGCVLYSHFSNGILLNESGIAHEIMHLFGARDLYETFRQKSDREEMARRFPNSIMHKNLPNINDQVIDELTAFLIGWHNRPKNWYEKFAYSVSK